LTLINDVKVRTYVTTSLRWKVIFDKYQDKDLSQETSLRHRDFEIFLFLLLDQKNYPTLTLNKDVEGYINVRKNEHMKNGTSTEK